MFQKKFTGEMVNEDGQHELITCLVFGDIVFQVTNIPTSSILTKSDLLKCRPIAEMKYVTEKMIITLVLEKWFQLQGKRTHSLKNMCF